MDVVGQAGQHVVEGEGREGGRGRVGRGREGERERGRKGGKGEEGVKGGVSGHHSIYPCSFLQKQSSINEYSHTIKHNSYTNIL